jgi:hypothetical protein
MRALRRLSAVRLTYAQLAVVAASSFAATALVFVGALLSSEPDAVTAALARRDVVVHRLQSTQTASVNTGVERSTGATGSDSATSDESGNAGASGNADAGDGTAAVDAGSAVGTAGTDDATSGSTPTATGADSGADSASATSGGTDGTSGVTGTGAGDEASGGTTGDGDGTDGANSQDDARPASATAAKPSKIRHVAIISLTSGGYAASFGDGASDSYLVSRLVPRGTLLSAYRLISDADLPNTLALVSGQPPNELTQQDCPTFAAFPRSAAVSRDGTVKGAGCVFPAATLTVADQLSAVGKSWRAYVGGTDAGATCQHPGVGDADSTVTSDGASPSAYATRHNPFVWFHSLLDDGDCATDDVAIDRLTHDLRSVRTTPNLAVIVPDSCDRGEPGACPAGQPSGAAAADAFLARWAPKILAAPAFRADGLLIVTFDGIAVSATSSPDATAGATTTPSTTTATTPTPSPAPSTTTRAASRRVGALLISRWTPKATDDARAADPYALLRTIEHLFGLPHLARAGASKTPTLKSAVLPEP